MGLVALVLGLGGVVLLVIGVLATRIPSTGLYLFKRLATRRIARGRRHLADSDELAVLLCGTGSPLPDPSRAGPSALVAAGNRLFLVDAGTASVRNLLLWRVPLNQVQAVLVTHFHSDHIAELDEINLQTWVSGRDAPLRVCGPPGVDEVVTGFNQAFGQDAAYRSAHHGEDFLPPAAARMQAVTVAIPSESDTALVLQSEDLTITAIRVQHDPVEPAYGYRFDYKGRSVVISGDTIADKNLAHAARDADVLVHDALNPQMVAALGEAMTATGNLRPAKIMQDVPGYHASPIDAAEVANTAGARLLVFTHMVPMLPNAAAERLFLSGVSAVRPNGVRLGHDGLLIRLPAHSTAINTTTLRA